MSALRIGVVGDIHGHWTASDNRWFDESGYDLLVVVGDLAGFRFGPCLAVARQLGQLACPTLVIPGNHDAPHAVQLVAETFGRPGLGRPFAGVHARNYELLVQAVAPHPLAAWSLHPVGEGDDALTVIAGRPHSMGGPSLAFRDHVEERWGVADLAGSVERFEALVEGVQTERIVFFAHNGPTGLGATRTSIWGCDFRAEEGDWGDPDLAAAVEVARARGHRVLAVAAGHMHRRIRGGGRREHLVERDGTLYVNAAEVPRIRDRRHHHVLLTIRGEAVEVADRWVDAP